MFLNGFEVGKYIFLNMLKIKEKKVIKIYNFPTTSWEQEINNFPRQRFLNPIVENIEQVHYI